MSENSQPVHGHVTIEKTAKRLKLQKLYGVCALIVGILLIFNGYGTDSKPTAVFNVGALTAFFAVVWLGMVNTKIWWNHG